MPRHLPVLIATAFVLAAGCDGETATGEGAPPPQEEPAAFSAQAEEICEGNRVELHDERADLFDDDIEMEPGDAQQSFERAAALLDSELTELRQLEPGEDVREGHIAWLAELEEAALAYQEAGESGEAAEELMRGEDPMLEAERTAEELGLEACGTQRQVEPELSPPPEG